MGGQARAVSRKQKGSVNRREVVAQLRASLPDATAVLVYGGLPTNRGELDALLRPDTTTLPLAAPRHAATTREASA